MQCNSCNLDKYDILRTNINIGDGCKCDDPCLDNCEKPVCDCPNGNTLDKCVFYTGCEKFLTQINPGMTYDQIVDKIERTFVLVDKKMQAYEDEIFEIKQILNEIMNKNESEDDCFTASE